MCLQLLDLMHTLHTRAATIFSAWADEERQRREERGQRTEDAYLQGLTEPSVDAQSSSLWLNCWCPLLQGRMRNDVPSR